VVPRALYRFIGLVDEITRGSASEYIEYVRQAGFQVVDEPWDAMN
jgi:hypothetical protein